MAVVKEFRENVGLADVHPKPIEFLTHEALVVVTAIRELEKSGEKTTFEKIGQQIMKDMYEDLSRKKIVDSPQRLKLEDMTLDLILDRLKEADYVRLEGREYKLTEYGRKELERYQAKPKGYMV